MNIVLDSRKVLNAIYELLDESSYTLVVKFHTSEMADKLDMSKEKLNLCIHYLIVAGYITGDYAFNNQDSATKELTLTALGINKVENAVL